MTDRHDEALIALSLWIDKNNAHRDPEAVTWGRLAKCAEEVGEVISAYIAMTGQNPRKRLHYLDASNKQGDKVLEELLDVAVTALGAIEHLTGHLGCARAMLDDKILRVTSRAGVK